MNYSVLPPEINSLRMFTGAGSAPMLAASVAWDGLAAELAVAASSFGSVTSGLAGQSWQGAAGGDDGRGGGAVCGVVGCCGGAGRWRVGSGQGGGQCV
ncbi:Conserved protein of unknown function, PPE family protein (part1) [Mycobacterium canettii CIPT 140070008]|nr:Conserved protein of unknown function, PPE family protein (part1) [Mycobacterium canettii CIPT 140070008]